MQSLIIVSIVAVILLIVLVLIFFKNEKIKQQLKDELEQKDKYTHNLELELTKYKIQLSEQNRSYEQQIELLQNNSQVLKQEFKNLANDILDTNSAKFASQNKQSLSDILNPMREQIGEFKQKIEDVYIQESKDRSALSAELNLLKELNIKMTTEASNLTNALKGDNKKQGIWGEMVLENVLESSGLRNGYEYDREVSLKDDENNSFRPDVIVNLPDNRHIIIDAKTSLVAYNEYVKSTDEEQKGNYLKQHIKSIKEHIKGLANKDYEHLQNINSLDFIFMFMPIESALLIALENDVNLYDEAFKQKIILVSPTTLLVALRAVENIWRYEKQAQSIADVYKRAEELYKKFYGFIDDLNKVQKGLSIANEAYDDAFKKLSSGRGNLVSQVSMLKKVSNIKPKKELDEVLVSNAMLEDE